MFKLDKCLAYLQRLGLHEKNETALHSKLSNVVSFITWLKKKSLIRETEYKKVLTLIEQLKLVKQPQLVTEHTDNDGSVKPKLHDDLTRESFYSRAISISFKFVLVLAFFVLGFLLLNSVQNNSSVDPLVDTGTGRVLTYTGVIKEPDGNPIDYKTDVIFKLYASSDSSVPLYAGSCVGEYGLVPKYNGTFNAIIGQDCGMRNIPDVVFTKYSDLFLGISIGTDEEMKPRQLIPKVGYAVQAEKLKGYSVGSKENTIPFIDENGVLLIDASSPKLRALSGNFTLEGEMITLQTTKQKGGSILLSPDKNTIITSGKLGIGNHNPTAALDIIGDASISGDLSFTNPYSQINLLNQSDLVFNTSSTNKRLTASMVLTNSGYLGIGTLVPRYNLTVEKDVPNSAVTFLSNKSSIDSEETNVLRLGLAVDKDAMKSNFIEFVTNTSGETATKVGSVRMNNGGVSFETAGADFAEYFTTDDTLSDGDIVTTRSTGVGKSIRGDSLVGVVSNTAGFVGNSKETNKKSVIVGLMGQIETNVSNINGSIQVGDKITTTKLNAYGGKAIDPGEIVGSSLENTKDTLLTNNNCPVQYRSLTDPNGRVIQCGKLRVLVNVSWYTPAQEQSEKPFILTNGTLVLTDEHNITTTKEQINTLQNSLKTGNEIVKSLLNVSKIFAGQITTGLLTGINIVVEEKITSPIIETEKLLTKDLEVVQIKPKDTSIEIDLTPKETASSDFAELAIKGLDGKKVASVDNAGNASFSGTITSEDIQAESALINNLTSDKLESKEASISGQLYAKEIKAENISSLEGSVSAMRSNLENSNSTLSQLRYDSTELNASLTQIKNELLNKNVSEVANPQYYQKLNEQFATPSGLLTNLNADLNIDSLTVTGTSNMYDLIVANKLTTGKLIIKDNEILSLAWDLKLSALSNVSFFDGLVNISKDGSLTTTGKVVAMGGLKTTSIESIDTDLAFKLKENEKNDSSGKFTFINAKNEEVASIDNTGRGKFQRLEVDSYQGATDEANLISSEDNFDQNGIFAPGLETDKKSAGVGVIPTGTKEVIIYNSNINDNSLIYTTPTTRIQSSLAVVEKESCSVKSSDVCKPYFKVSHNDMGVKNIQFNWFIVN